MHRMLSRTPIGIGAFLGTVLVLSGCGQPDSPSPPGGVNAPPAQASVGDGTATIPGESPDATASPSPPPAAGDDVRVQIRDWQQTQALVAQKRGKVVVLDCWSTSCDPCKEEFPRLVALHHKYGPDRLAAVSLSLDYIGLGKVEDVQGPVLDFLRQQKAVFDNVLCSEEDTVMYQKLQIDSIPAVLVYNQQGELARVFQGEGNLYDQVESYVAELLEGE